MNSIMHKYYKNIGLLKWSLLRHKFYIPAFIVVQIILSVAVIYGFSFITNAKDDISRVFLCTGAVTINILAVTCVLAPQIVSEAKQNGVFHYQKTLPISGIGILLTDVFIWGILSIPGILLCMIVGTINFEIHIYLNYISIGALVLVIVILLLLGFAIAYIFPANMVSLITQIIMIVGLLFSPIVYSADRLPEWMSYIYNLLPFVPSSNIIRSSIFHLYEVQVGDYLVVIFWGILSFLITMYVLTKRK